ncbi:MAG: phage tail tape measure protein, partial [bacterium]|nr:phage tail tape measure protein [bacterium]
MGSDLARVSGIFAGAAGAGAAALAWPLQMAANLEKTEAAFTTLLKDGNKAKALLGELRDFAASTPLQFDEIADAAKKLIAFGSSAGDVKEELRRIGDIAGAVGAPISEIAEIYGKARVQGRLFAEDVNQLTGRGIPVLESFAAQLGVTKDQLKDAVKDGKLGFANLEQAFKDLTSGSGQFAGGLEKQSKTLIGAFSTLKDNIEAAFRPFGEALLPAAKGALGIATKAVQAFSKWAERNKGLAVGFAAAVAALGVLGSSGLAASAVFFGLSQAMTGIGAAGGLVGSAVGAGL